MTPPTQPAGKAIFVAYFPLAGTVVDMVQMQSCFDSAVITVFSTLHDTLSHL